MPRFADAHDTRSLRTFTIDTHAGLALTDSDNAWLAVRGGNAFDAMVRSALSIDSNPGLACPHNAAALIGFSKNSPSDLTVALDGSLISTIDAIYKRL
jgi:hypothetical protein